MRLIVPKQWRSQPPYFVPAIRTGLGSGLRHFWTDFGRAGAGAGTVGLWNAAKAQVNGVFGTGSPGTGNLHCATAYGSAIKFDDTGTGTAVSARLAVGDTSGSGASAGSVLSLFALINFGATGQQSIFAGGNHTAEWRMSTTSTIDFLKSGDAAIGTSTTALSASRWYALGVSYDGTTANFYLNGLADGSGSSVQTFILTTQHYIGHDGQVDLNTPRIKNGALVALFGVWDRVVSAPEMRALATNPWQLFRPQQRRMYVNTVAGGGGGSVFGANFYRHVAGMGA